jgi:hypothetical protein
MRELAVFRGKLFDECTLSLTPNDDWDKDHESGTMEDNGMAEGNEGSGEESRSPERERPNGKSGSRAEDVGRGSGGEGINQYERTLSVPGESGDQDMVDGLMKPNESKSAKDTLCR